MAIFAVIGSNQPQELDTHLKSEFGEHEVLPLSPGQWLISTSQTTSEVFSKIGEDGEHGEFLLLPVKQYAGFQESTVWEWLESKESK